MQSLLTAEITCPSYTSPAAPDQDQKFIDVRMNAIRRKIIILSGKGGTAFWRTDFNDLATKC